MNIKQLSLAAAVSALTFATASNAVLGPIPIYLNTEYRTDAPVIGSIASTLSFDANDIKATGANTFLDFLATVPSVGLVNPQGNIPALFIRGNEARHTLVLVDGVSVHDISSPDAAAGYGLASVALNDIEKIEIIKGSGSVVYGASAIGGVISVTTKKGAEGEHASVSTKFGTHNSKTYTLVANGGDKEGFIRFTHNKYSTDGINAITRDGTNEKDSISNRSTQIKVGNENYDISYLKSNNKTNYDNYFYDDNPTGFSERDLTKVAINVNKKISDTWKAKSSITQTKFNRKYEYGNDKLKSTNITILNDIKINDALLNVGFSQVKDENITKTQALSSKDLFVNWQKNINSIDVNTGIRHIKHDEFGNHTIYNAGIGKHIDNGIKLTANYNTAFNAPSLYQASDTDNPATLKPETSKNINLGLSKQQSWGKVNLAVYKNTVNGLIAYKASSNPYTDWYTNEEKLSTKGVELSISGNLAEYNVNFSHDYNESRLNNEAKQVVRRPKNTTNLTINKQYRGFDSRMQLIKKSSSRDHIELDGYTLVNLSTNYNISNNTKVSFGIKNATDRNYKTATVNTTETYNNLRRTVELGLEYKF